MVEILVAMFLAFGVMWALIVYAGEKGGWGAWPVFFLFFFAILAGGLWLTPVGPPLVGVYWVPFLFVAIFIALFWAAASPMPKRKRRRSPPPSEPRMEDDQPVAPVGLSILFWLLLAGLAMVALFRYATTLGPLTQAS
ncbi:MAG: hypothetical protein A4E19_19965 [Nitrospira sp. SG-bin1]|nr:MAG: hypothetical protein A4E19_19965 [Nitrospira sp. SG-bin1]